MNYSITQTIRKSIFLSILLAISFIKTTKSDKNFIDNQILTLVKNSSLRVFSGNIAVAIQNLDEYGCWCYFYNNIGRGKSQPVDEVDGFCKVLHEGYMCAIMDAENVGESCIPWEIEYQPGSGAGINVFRHCIELNPNSVCAQMACAVEGQFVDNMFAFLLSGSQIDYDSFGHNNGFEPSDNFSEGNCPIKILNTPGMKACCGRYPFRFAYKTLDGERACCGMKTYNTGWF